MFWFANDKMLRLVSLTFNLSEELKIKIQKYAKEQLQIELTFSRVDAYILNENNKELQYLNILHDICCDLFDIDNEINKVINDDLFYENRTIINNIGSYGTTELVEFNGEIMVRKRPKAYYPSLYEEYRFMEKLYLNNQDYFVKVVKDDYSNSYLMELATDTLSSFIEEKPKIDIKTATLIINSIIDEVDYIHKAGYIHNDLHIDNILLFTKDGRPKWKISDFGMSYNFIENGFVISGLFPESRRTEYIDYHKNNNTIQNDFYSIGRIINFIFTKKPGSFQHPFREISDKCKKRQYKDAVEIKRDYNRIVNDFETQNL